MTRKEFIKICGLLGIGLPLQSVLSSYKSAEKSSSNNIEKVIIVGAGAGGLAAGYLLNQRGIKFQILEASSTHGGRMKRTLDFADFPIPLGAEWLHVKRGVFAEIINDTSITADIATTPYNPERDYGLYEGERIRLKDVGITIDQKFINATWFDFFEQYIVPSVREHITYDTIVESIDYSGKQLLVKTKSEELTADRVIVSVSVRALQNDLIKFIPQLPEKKAEAIRNVRVWDGCKAFIAFSEKFYPTFIDFSIKPKSAGQKLYYDASYGQNTTQNILGLFAVGTGTLPYVNLTDAELKEYMLSELDEMFEAKASKSYIKHIFQNWNKDPYANGAYVSDQEKWRTVRTLGKSVEDKLFFAGDAYTDGEDWSSVHVAARSAKRAVEELLR